jgi:hypothetical protein
MNVDRQQAAAEAVAVRRDGRRSAAATVRRLEYNAMNRSEEWIENGQRFRYEGYVIRSQKPAKLRVAYGDERLRELAEYRADAGEPELTGIRRLFSRLLTRDEGLSH